MDSMATKNTQWKCNWIFKAIDWYDAEDIGFPRFIYRVKGKILNTILRPSAKQPFIEIEAN